MDNKKKKIIKIIIGFCLAIIVIELLIMLVMKIVRERNLERIDGNNRVVLVDDGYIVVGESDFYHSDYVSEKVYDHTNNETKSQEKIVAAQAKIAKYDKDMNLVWESTIDGKYDSSFYDVLEVSDGFIAVGSYISDYKQIDYHTRDAIVVKYDKDGKIVWTNTYSVLTDTEFYRIIDDGDDNYIIVGQSIYENMEMGNHYTGGGIIVRINASGEITDHNNYGGNKSGIFNDVIKVDDGYIVCGKDAVNYGIVVKFQKNFNREEDDKKSISKKVVWQRTYSNTDDSGFTDMVVIGDKIYAIGAVNVSNEKDKDGKTIFKYEAGFVMYNTSGKYFGTRNLEEGVHHNFVSGATDNEYLYLIMIMDVDNYDDDAVHGTTLVKMDLDGKVISKKLISEEEKNTIFTQIVKADDNYLVTGTINDRCSLLDGCDYQGVLKYYNNELEAK